MVEVQPILIDLPDELVGEKVVVRPWAESDSRGLWDAVDGSRDHLAPWMPWVDAYRNPDDARAYVRRSRAEWLLRENLPTAIVERGTGEIVGGSGFHRIHWQIRRFEIGYWVRQDREGRGYVSEAVRLLTRLAFDHLDANRVEIRADPRNHKSLRVADRLGYVLEATLRSALPAADGSPADVHVMALLPAEYRALPWATPR